MLDPEYLQRVTEGAEAIAEDLHINIVKRIVSAIMLRLQRNDEYLITAKDKWQMEVLKEAGYLSEDIQKEIAKKTGLQYKEIKAAFEDAGERAIAYDAEIYQAAGISTEPLSMSPYLIRLMQRNYEATAHEWANFTRTTAEAAQQLFIQQCDKAYTLVTSGTTSYTEAVKDAVNEICKDGVKVIYPSGHEDTIETATLRAVRTGVSQACAEITNTRMEEVGWDIVLTSAHLGARYGDGGENFTNHYWWQGKFYSLSGKDKRFPPFSVCGQGDVQGINGANCRHSYGPGDGVNNPFEHFDSEENKRIYDIEQKQRKMERAIRKTKRQVMGLKEAVDHADNITLPTFQDQYQKAALKLQNQNQAYKTFCEQNDLKTRNDRLSIAQWDRQQAAAARAAARKENNKKE